MGVLAGQAAFLIGTAIEGILYGAYLVLVGYAARIMLWRRRSDSINWVQISLMGGMFLASSAHYFFGLHASVVGFINHGDEKDGPLNYLASAAVGYPMDIMLSITFVMSDLTMMHRLWLVWQKNYVVIIAPVLLMIAYLTTWILSLQMMVEGGRDIAKEWPTIVAIAASSYSASAIFSLVVTGLLAWRVYIQTRQLSAAFPGQPHVQQYKQSILIVVESGAIIFFAQVINVTVYVVQYKTGHNIWELIGLPLTQIYAIVPTLIITRVALGVSTNEKLTTVPNSSVRFANGTSTGVGSFPMQKYSADRSLTLRGADSSNDLTFTASGGAVHLDEEKYSKSDVMV